MISLFTFYAHHAEWRMAAVRPRVQESVHYLKELRNVKAFRENPR